MTDWRQRELAIFYGAFLTLFFAIGCAIGRAS